MYCRNFNRHTNGYCSAECRDEDLKLFIEENSIVDIDVENYCSCVKCGQPVNSGNVKCPGCY